MSRYFFLAYKIIQKYFVKSQNHKKFYDDSRKILTQVSMTFGQAQWGETIFGEVSLSQYFKELFAFSDKTIESLKLFREITES